MNSLFQAITSSSTTNNKVVPINKIETVSNQIMISALTFDMFIGVLPEEKQSHQKVVIDLNADITLNNTQDDDLKNTVSYVELIDRIQGLANSKHFNLVETFAYEIAEICFSYRQIENVEITVKKPDIIDNTNFVGFSLKQRRAD